MTTQRKERLAAGLEWQRSVVADGPSADDVELVALLGITDAGVAKEIVFNDPAAVLRHWDALQGALNGSATSSAPTPAAPPPPLPVETPDPEPSVVEVREQPVDVIPTTSLTGPARARFAALTRWVESEASSGTLFDLPEGTLEAIAQFDPEDRNFAKRLVAQLRTYAPQLKDVLRGAEPPAELEDPAPLATPAAAPASATPVTPSAPTATGTTSTTGFAAFDYTSTATAPTPLGVSFTVAENEDLTISWPRPVPPTGQVTIFRVVTNTSYAPMAPELGDTIAATFDTEVIDERRLSAPTLYVAVWMNVGPTEEAARAAQPLLHAQGGCVLPVRRCVVRADGDAVVGQWQVADGVQRIDVERVPKHLLDEHPHYTHDFRLPADMVSRGGFKDTGAPAGGDFVYRIYALASIGGEPEELSPPVSRDVRIDAIIEAVTDLHVQPREGTGDRFDLTWTMPVVGRVEIFRNERPPASGIGAQVLARSAIELQGLTDDLRLVQQMVVENGQGRMLDIPWPAGWSRAYFTPVTVLSEDQLQVGSYQVITRARPLTHVRLIERVDKQFLTFSWPDGVTEVRIYRGPRGGTFVDPEHDQPIFQLSHEEYTKFGGAHLRELLPPEGCAVHLVATTYARAKAQYSAPVSIDYPGLSRFWYTLEILETQGGLFKGAERTTKRRLLVKSDSEITVPMVLVHHPERLPLSVEDGQIIHRKEMSFHPGVAVEFADQFDVGGHSGYIRLFAHVGRDEAPLRAVLDPAIDELRCGS